MDYKIVVDGMKALTAGLKNNVWPDAFFRELLGMSEESIDRLPEMAFYFMIVYGISAVISLILHYAQKQKSFSDLGRKIAAFLSCFVAVMCCWIVPQFIAQGKLLASDVKGEFSFTQEGMKWLSDFLQAWFDPVFLIILLVAISMMPVFSIRRYIKNYKLLGIPWAIYDVGFPLLCFSAAILAMANGNLMWYVAIPVGLTAVWLGQTGGADIE